MQTGHLSSEDQGSHTHSEDGPWFLATLLVQEATSRGQTGPEPLPWQRRSQSVPAAGVGQQGHHHTAQRAWVDGQTCLQEITEVRHLGTVLCEEVAGSQGAEET